MTLTSISCFFFEKRHKFSPSLLMCRIEAFNFLNLYLFISSTSLCRKTVCVCTSCFVVYFYFLFFSCCCCCSSEKLSGWLAGKVNSFVSPSLSEQIKRKVTTIHFSNELSIFLCMLFFPRTLGSSLSLSFRF